MTSDDQARVSSRIDEFLSTMTDDMSTTDRYARQFDAGLAWVHFPEGCGGLGAKHVSQKDVDDALEVTGLSVDHTRNLIGIGVVAPALIEFGTRAQIERHLRPIWTGEEVWCQLFSEPMAGSDLANVAGTACRTEDGDWRVDAHKIWTSHARNARWALALLRVDEQKSKHEGLACFIVDMWQPGVTVRPLRQITGEEIFSEVRLDGVHAPSDAVIGELSQGWTVASRCVTHERQHMGGRLDSPELPAIGRLVAAWSQADAASRDWLAPEIAELIAAAAEVQLANAYVAAEQNQGANGAQASAVKLLSSSFKQHVTRTWVLVDAVEGLAYDDLELLPDPMSQRGTAAFHYLRSKASSIAGGTSEIMRDIIARRVLGMPTEPRNDVRIAWKDLP